MLVMVSFEEKLFVLLVQKSRSYIQFREIKRNVVTKLFHPFEKHTWIVTGDINEFPWIRLTVSILVVSSILLFCYDHFVCHLMEKSATLKNRFHWLQFASFSPDISVIQGLQLLLLSPHCNMKTIKKILAFLHNIRPVLTFTGMYVLKLGKNWKKNQRNIKKIQTI